MNKKLIWAIMWGCFLMSSTWSVFAYSIWSPVQYVKQIFVTSDGSNNQAKSTITLDGTNGTIDAKNFNWTESHIWNIILWYRNELDNIHGNLYLQYRGRHNTIINAQWGKVGIGTMDPHAALDVNGDIKMNGLFVATEAYVDKHIGHAEFGSNCRWPQDVGKINRTNGKICHTVTVTNDTHCRNSKKDKVSWNTFYQDRWNNNTYRCYQGYVRIQAEDKGACPGYCSQSSRLYWKEIRNVGYVTVYTF